MKTLLNLGSALLLFAGMLFSVRVSASASGLIFNVTTSLDSVDAAPGNGVCADSNGQCSLRAAIMEANSTLASDVIVLPPATYVLTLTGSGEDLAATGDLDVDNTLTIQGSGSSDTIIDATRMGDRVFQARPGSNVTISGVTIRNGTNGSTSPTTPDQFGGGILNEGTFYLSSSTVSASSAQFGGGIFNYGGMFTVDLSTITGNHADNEGGGIANLNGTAEAVFSLNNSTVSGNDTPGSNGGGIINVGTLTINNSTLSANISAGAGGGIGSGSGTGVFLTLNDSKVTGNHADFGGGGIDTLGAMTLNSSEISGNTAGGTGGGIITIGSITVKSSTVSSNQAVDGGGIYFSPSVSSDTLSMSDSTLTANSASGSGGGLYASGGGANLARVTLGSNTAVLNGGGMLLANGTVIRMTNSTLSDNSAGQSGGGIEVAGGELHGSNLTIAGNIANTSHGVTGIGGGIDNSGTVNLKNTILALNVHQSTGSPVDDDCHGVFGLLSYNLVGTVGCTFTSDHTLTGLDPLLNPLANNGGLTFTRALQSASPAIDAGNPAGCTDDSLAMLTTDQRGLPRPIDGNLDGTIRCDIGAFEYGHLVFIPVILR